MHRGPEPLVGSGPLRMGYACFFCRLAFGSSAAPSSTRIRPQRSNAPQNSTMRISRVLTRTRLADALTRFQNTLAMEDHSTKFSGTHSVNVYTGWTENVSSSQARPTRPLQCLPVARKPAHHRICHAAEQAYKLLAGEKVPKLMRLPTMLLTRDNLGTEMRGWD